MMRFLKLLLLLPVVLGVLAIALANRQLVMVSFDPFAAAEGHPGPQIAAPLYLVLLVSVMVGVVIGGVATWIEQGRHRRAARRAIAEARRLTAEATRFSSSKSLDKRKTL
ncbi:lipopolysaccharide assembly protein LapA domain-containing protein [Methylocapsa polymorpha]|uniref:Lipopolysaccharide assembly protein LapA domain-containing protein n=1 Tax=Methylocapsa polymorpha TaxID=3080828 RepID=A0ABZ0HPD7_9HYPH|nr:lipopolysaccharide assembly protein LapA domain-containing protein [Methylocapsa sp. RX1]